MLGVLWTKEHAIMREKRALYENTADSPPRLMAQNPTGSKIGPNTAMQASDRDIPQQR